jgi:hypothetical protein
MSEQKNKSSVKDVEAFGNVCVYLRAIYHHYELLFECGSLRTELLTNTAPIFFGDLNRILVEQMYSLICAITDPEKDRKYENLTIKFFLNNAEFSGWQENFDRLKKLSESIHEFREKILPARHKLIGHLDRTAVLKGEPLGGVEQCCWDQFWRDLQEAIHILYKQFGISDHFYLDDVGYISDADSLIKALKESTYFHALLADGAVTQKCAEVSFGSKYLDA